MRFWQLEAIIFQDEIFLAIIVAKMNAKSRCHRCHDVVSRFADEIGRDHQFGEIRTLIQLAEQTAAAAVDRCGRVSAMDGSIVRSYCDATSDTFQCGSERRANLLNIVVGTE